jgi:hypothetical protein
VLSLTEEGRAKRIGGFFLKDFDLKQFWSFMKPFSPSKNIFLKPLLVK